MASKKRLDVLLVERGMAASRSLAQRMVMAGQVRVDGHVAVKPSVKIHGGAAIEIDVGPRYVSRGGEKLEAALDKFPIDVEGFTCADVGASTGGFTDCLLQHGAKKVYAIDVGKGILDWKLRKDKRVEVMEETNARYVKNLPELVDLVTIDTSFISLKVLLPAVKGWLGETGGVVIALIKPQFEAGREAANKGKGVIRDPEIHRQVLEDVLGFANEEGYGARGLVRSPLVGPKGNVEFLAHLTRLGENADETALLISQVFSNEAQG
ncbi:MAG: TlyA family RNA methyltransferase [Chloroflexi bacterium]|nr:TlyA family RNA methyltransferase [Chloroflexota bacterium]